MALLFWARDQATCTMSNQSLARYVGGSISTVERSLRELAGLGYIAAEFSRPTASNATGRVIRLRWVEDPGVLPAQPIRSDRPKTRDAGSGPSRTQPAAVPPSPAPGGPITGEGGGPSPVRGEGPSRVTDKEDRFGQEEKNFKKIGSEENSPQRQRPEATDGILSRAHSPAAPTPPPDAPPPLALALDRLMRAVRPAEPVAVPEDPSPLPLAPPPVLVEDQARTTEPVPDPAEAPAGLAEGQLQALAAMTSAEREAFEGKSPGFRAQILAPFAAGYDAHFFEQITRSQVVVPRFVAAPPPVDRSTTGLVAAVAEGDPRRVPDLAESLCRDLGGPGDRRRWGALHALARQVLYRIVAADDVLDAYRQAMGPKALNRGAVFTTALKRLGWRPDVTRPPLGALGPATARAS